jgi:glutathione S-transferase
MPLSISRPVSGPVRLLGTTTSPYVRKVRILAAAAQLPFELVDTRHDAGADLLARLAPVGKVPVLLIGDGDSPEVLPDSSLIAQRLWVTHQPALRAAGFLLDPEMWEERALQVVVEGCLDAAINRFYLLRDGFAETGYLARQRDRLEATLAWLDGRLTFRRPCGAATLSLGCALDWMVFRGVVDLARFPGLTAFREAWTASGIGAGTEPG